MAQSSKGSHGIMRDATNSPTARGGDHLLTLGVVRKIRRAEDEDFVEWLQVGQFYARKQIAWFEVLGQSLVSCHVAS